MGRLGSLEAEVVWSAHDSAAEMVLPDAIHDHSRCQRILRICDPAGKGQAPAACFASRLLNRRSGRIQDRKETGLDEVSFNMRITSQKNVSWPRSLLFG